MATDTKSFDTSAASDVGMRRKDNQDSFARADKWLGANGKPLRDRYGRLYVVADGVGGNEDGGRASKLVARNLMEHFYHDPDAPETLLERLRYAIMQTSRDLHADAIAHASNMASTVVAALIHDSEVIIANVGDSPALLFRHDMPPKQLTIDHVVQRADGSRVLVQSMGDAEVNVAFFTTDFLPGDVLVLCTDGLTDLVTTDEIGRVVIGQSAHEAGRALIRLANARGGPDNITALVVRHGKLSPLSQGRYYYAAALAIVTLGLIALLWWLLASRSTQAGGPPHPTSTGGIAASTPTLDATPVASTGPSLVVADPATRTPLPTPTPTDTPTPTPIDTPTNTPTPTKTPRPTPTRTPRPTLVPATSAPASGETPGVATPPGSGPAGRRLFRVEVNDFPNSSPSDSFASCIEGHVRDRSNNGISNAIIRVTNGNYSFFENSKAQGEYQICGLGASLWSVELRELSGQDSSSLARPAIAEVYVNGSGEQHARVNFIEQ